MGECNELERKLVEKIVNNVSNAHSKVEMISKLFLENLSPNIAQIRELNAPTIKNIEFIKVT